MQFSRYDKYIAVLFFSIFFLTYNFFSTGIAHLSSYFWRQYAANWILSQTEDAWDTFLPIESSQVEINISAIHFVTFTSFFFVWMMRGHNHLNFQNITSWKIDHTFFFFVWLEVFNILTLWWFIWVFVLLCGH